MGGEVLKMVRVWARRQNCLKRLLASSYLSVRLSVLKNSAPTGRISIESYIWIFF